MTRLTRRSLLRAAGMGAAGALFAPFYRSLRADAPAPRRFVIFVEGNGIEPANFLCDAMRADLSAAGSDVTGRRYPHTAFSHDAPVISRGAALSTAPSLGALAQGGLESRALVVHGLSSKITGGGHSTEAGALSCTRSPSGSPSGPTIDHVLSGIEGVRAGSPFPVVRLGVVGGDTRLNYSTCAFDARRPAPIVCDPTTAFNSLFGSVASGAGMRAFTERRQLLDFALDDVQRALATFSGSSRERVKLERYLESLEAMVTRQEIISGMGPRLAEVKPGEPDAVPLYTSEAPLERLQAQVDMATAALLGGLTHVVVVALGTGSRYFSLDYTSLIDLYPGRDMIGGHDVRHSAEDGAQGYVDLLTEITSRHVALMSSMARALEATPEANAPGSMLDHTLMLYMSDNGERHHSRAEDWPMLMIGGDALGFRTDGRALAFPRLGSGGHRQVSNVFNTLGYAAGVELDDFGAEASSRVALGPLSELWS
jgi:hypothetical protein